MAALYNTIRTDLSPVFVTRAGELGVRVNGIVIMADGTPDYLPDDSYTELGAVADYALALFQRLRQPGAYVTMVAYQAVCGAPEGVIRRAAQTPAALVAGVLVLGEHVFIPADLKPWSWLPSGHIRTADADLAVVKELLEETPVVQRATVAGVLGCPKPYATRIMRQVAQEGLGAYVKGTLIRAGYRIPV